jgi:hypothetical protein
VLDCELCGVDEGQVMNADEVSSRLAQVALYAFWKSSYSV